MGMKEKMMNDMMDQFFSKMSGEEKQQMMTDMMDKFMGSMSAEEKSSMMKNMMPEMMKNMMGGSGGMMGMMSGLMGGMKGGEGPMDMCQKMMGSFSKTAEMAAYGTPELRGLFEEWLTQIEDELEKKINAGMTVVDKLAAEFHIGTESIHYLLNRLSRKGRINISVAGK